MATIEQLAAHLYPYKLAVVTVFGIDPSKALTNGIHIDTQHVVIELCDGGAKTFPLDELSARQRHAVDEYLRQFPDLGGFMGRAVAG